MTSNSVEGTYVPSLVSFHVESHHAMMGAKELGEQSTIADSLLKQAAYGRISPNAKMNLYTKSTNVITEKVDGVKVAYFMQEGYFLSIDGLLIKTPRRSIQDIIKGKFHKSTCHHVNDPQIKIDITKLQAAELDSYKYYSKAWKTN
ncbi:hypothetical protein PSN45_003252 [Yamadazyma tenuis]|uniref:uncharacterized protein n=1 Tax=Candida tenuis TaxID=2315449 RepID=UPI0027A0103A|nr:hypothetical protein PSN45_003252 [Yamadazyma tenuis]